MTCLDWSSDNKRLASGSWDKTVRIWDIEQGTCVREFTAHRFAATIVFAAVTSIWALSPRSPWGGFSSAVYLATAEV